MSCSLAPFLMTGHSQNLNTTENILSDNIYSINIIDLKRFNLHIHLINIIYSRAYADSVNGQALISSWKILNIIQ